MEALVRSEIHAENAHVAVGRVGTFDVVRHPVAFPYVQTQPVVHGGATEVVGNEREAQAIRVVAAVGQRAHHVVHLVDVFFQADIERCTAFKRSAVEGGSPALNPSEVLLTQPLDLGPRRSSHDAEHHFVRMVVARDKALNGRTVHGAHRIGVAENVATHGVAFE